MSALLTPAADNTNHVQACRKLAKSTIEVPELNNIFFGAPAVNSTIEKIDKSPPTVQKSFQLKSWTVQRLKKYMPSRLDVHWWHKKLCRQSVPLFRDIYANQHPDILHCRAGMYHWFAPAVMARDGKSSPRIVFHLGYQPMMGALPGFVVNLWRKADYMIYVSTPVKEAWEQAYPALVDLPNQVVHHGVDTSRFPYTDRTGRAYSAANPFRIGICSRLTYAKGIDDGIRAFAEFHRQRPFSVLEIVGDGSEKSGLIELSRQLGIAEAVFFHGHQVDILSYLQRFDLFLQPSRNEAFGISNVEAMSTGLPVIATKAGGIIDVLADQETGYLVDIGDVKSMTNRMLELENDPLTRSQFGLAARQRAISLFSVDRMCNDIHKIYDQIS